MNRAKSKLGLGKADKFGYGQSVGPSGVISVDVPNYQQHEQRRQTLGKSLPKLPTPFAAAQVLPGLLTSFAKVQDTFVAFHQADCNESRCLVSVSNMLCVVLAGHENAGNLQHVKEQVITAHHVNLITSGQNTVANEVCWLRTIWNGSVCLVFLDQYLLSF